MASFEDLIFAAASTMVFLGPQPPPMPTGPPSTPVMPEPPLMDGGDDGAVPTGSGGDVVHGSLSSLVSPIPLRVKGGIDGDNTMTAAVGFTPAGDAGRVDRLARMGFNLDRSGSPSEVSLSTATLGGKSGLSGSSSIQGEVS